MRFRYKLYFLIIIIILIFGCSNPFNPGFSQNRNVSVEYVYKPTTPENVLKNLIEAYNQKDLNIYKNCLSDSFRFQLKTSDIPEIGIDWWGYEQEVEYHNNLFGKGSSDGSFPSPDNIVLTLEIPPQSNWENDTQTGHEKWVIIACPFYLHLFYSNQTDISASGFARFYLKQENDQWVIAMWVDESYL